MTHCDGFYEECSARGKLDHNDIREGKHGQLRKRQLCLSGGIYPANDQPCRHCIETRKRRKSTHQTGRVRHSHVEHIVGEGDIIVTGRR